MPVNLSGANKSNNDPGLICVMGTVDTVVVMFAVSVVSTAPPSSIITLILSSVCCVLFKRYAWPLEAKKKHHTIIIAYKPASKDVGFF